MSPSVKMQSLDQLTKDHIKNLKLVCFDVDGVTIKKGTDIEEKETKTSTTLTVKTKKLSPEMRDILLELKKHYFICINSGRSSLYLTEVFNELLWDNVALISEVGIFMLVNGELIQNEKFDKKILDKMRDIKLELAKLDDTNRQIETFEPKQFLITLHAKSEVDEVYSILKRVDPEGDFHAYWTGEAFDILPTRLNKGVALTHLAKYLDITLDQTLAIGNGANDKDMTEAAGIGITTEPDHLVSDFFTTEKQHAGGIQLAKKLIDLAKQ